MKRGLMLLSCVASLVGLPAFAADFTAEQIVEKNVAARGGLDAWRAVNTMTMSGEMEVGGKPDAKLPFVFSLKRPHKSRLEVRFQEQTALQVFDGKQGWKVRPFLNRNDAEPFTAAEAKSAATSAELDGPLVDYAKKGTKVELQGKELIEGKNTYKLMLTKKTGEKVNLWVDASTFLEVKIDGEPRKLDGRIHKVGVFYRDYRPVNGLTVPFGLETVVAGVKQTRKMTIQTVAVNKPLEDALFAKPKMALAQTTGTIR